MPDQDKAATQAPGEVVVPFEHDASASIPASAPASTDIPTTSTNYDPVTSTDQSAGFVPTGAIPAAEPSAATQTLPPPASASQPVVGTTNQPPAPQTMVQSPAVPGSFAQTPYNSPPDNILGTEALLEWQATEFADRQRTSTWYGAMVLGAIVVAVIVYLLNKDFFLSGAVLVGLVGLAFVSGRRPRSQHYEVSSAGIHVGKLFYDFHGFRSFAVDPTSTGGNLILTPMKRFMPAITIAVPGEYVEAITNLLSEIMPMEQHKPDLVDFISSKFHL